MTAMRETWVIASNVFRQLLRNRILVVLSVFALALVGVVAFLGDLGQEAEKRLGQDFGLLAIEAVGFFTVLLCHVVLLFEETELKTYSILLVKPVERWQVLLGRVLGAWLLLMMNVAGMTALLQLLSWWRGLALVDGDTLAATAYLAAGGALFSAVTGFFSVLASSVPAAAMFATFAFALGHFTTNLLDWVERLHQPGLKLAVQVLYWATPNFSLFNLREHLDAAGSAGSGGLLTYLWPLGYAACYGGVVLGLALWRYEHKDF
jgi:ABC-type transport system involved in multi-copper enzyme maturation permease subunit